MSENRCLLCGEDEKSSRLILVKNGLGTLIHSSKLRDDSVHKLLQGMTTALVHGESRKAYIHPKYIESERNRRDAAKEQYMRRRPSAASIFDFKKKCMICGKAVPTEEQRIKYPDRDPVSVVATLLIHDSVRNAASNREDSWGREVVLRIENAIDLVAVEARYHRKCYSSFSTNQQSLSSPGRPRDQAKFEAFEKLCQYMEEHDDSQFIIQDLIQRLRLLSPLTEPYTATHLLSLLQSKYGEQIFFGSQTGLNTVLCLKGTAAKVLNKSWYEQRSADPREERLRVVNAAAQIVREDIRAREYDTSRYPSPEEVASGGQDLVPESLQQFVETVACKGKRGVPGSLKRKCLALEHNLIQITRPRSFLSPVHFGLTVTLHKTFGSRYLIDILNSLGHCISYAEVSKYEAVVALKIRITIDRFGFVQFVFDNVDINIQTLDGKNTVHSMGGIQCVTPATAVFIASEIPRGPHFQPSQDDFRGVAEIPVQFWRQTNTSVYKAMKVLIPDEIPGTGEVVTHAQLIDTLWLAATWQTRDDAPFPGWNGFMSAATSYNKNFEATAVIPTPFVNLQPSNPTTIFTCLKYASDQCKARNQSHCLVTFDQPLFQKAIVMVIDDPSLSPVIPRLGGFHQLMSYLGAVGFVMAGSGIEQVWETVYARNSVQHMMTGHSFSRGLRAHFLTQQALVHILLESLPARAIPTAEIHNLAVQLMTGVVSCEEAVESPCIRQVSTSIEAAMQVASRNRMGKLWVTYIRSVQVMRNFVRAERSGQWKLHIHSIREMLALLFASGHLHYVKSSLLYLQSMASLEEKMSASDFDKFTRQGFFTIRRSSKFWGGIWTDLTIEQTLMRKLKARGGLTQGRGTGPGAVAKFLQTAPATFPVIDAVETFTNVRAETSEQHKELRESRKKRDRYDLEKIFTALSRHRPFEERENNTLVSLYTGAIADESVDCDQALERGLAAMERAVGTPYGDFHVRRNDRVKSLASMNLTLRTKGKGNTVQINPNQLFHRLICALERQQKQDLLPRCFSYEMSVRPLALFDETFMRKGTKSSFVEQLQKYSRSTQEVPNNPTYTLDGGFLLHRVTWPSPATYLQVCQVYVAAVAVYGECAVVFDGYSRPSTKDEAHLRRGSTVTSTDLEIRKDIFVTVSRDTFLSNETNKTKFIELLSGQLREAGVTVAQASGDADTLIVNTAISSASNGQNSVVVGEDTDLLVLLTALTPNDHNTFMLMPGRGGAQRKVFNIKSLKQSLGDLTEMILFFSAFTGCDTTSAPYKRGKLKSWQKLLKCSEDFILELRKFNNCNVTHDQIAAAGEKFMLLLYGAPPSRAGSLDQLRYECYQRSISKKSPGAEFQLATLPPTSAATRQHSFRVYYQVQEWLGNDLLQVTEWGWSLQGNHLRPVTTAKAPAPEDLLHVVFCNCPTECSSQCDCRRSGIPCSAMCGYCGGTSCDNPAPHVDSSSDESDPDDPDS